MPRAKVTEKFCKRCEQTKPRSEYYEYGSRYGISAYCKPCMREKSKAQSPPNKDVHAESCRRYYANNREAVLGRLKQWRLDNPNSHRNVQARRRALKKTSEVEFVDRMEVFLEEDGWCGVCGGKADINNFHLDHIVPLSKGGPHIRSNVQVSHPECNWSKGARESVLLPLKIGRG